jgi:hypothetical protein
MDVSEEEGSWETLEVEGRVLFEKMLCICSRYGIVRQQ